MRILLLAGLVSCMSCSLIAGTGDDEMGGRANTLMQKLVREPLLQLLSSGPLTDRTVVLKRLEKAQQVLEDLKESINN